MSRLRSFSYPIVRLLFYLFAGDGRELSRATRLHVEIQEDAVLRFDDRPEVERTRTERNMFFERSGRGSSVKLLCRRGLDLSTGELAPLKEQLSRLNRCVPSQSAV